MTVHNERGLEMIPVPHGIELRGNYGTIRQAFLGKYLAKGLEYDYLNEVDKRWRRIGKLVSA